MPTIATRPVHLGVEGIGPEMLGEGGLFTQAGGCLLAAYFHQIAWVSKVGPGNCEGTVFLMRFPVGAASSSTGNITRIALLAVFYYFCFCS